MCEIDFGFIENDPSYPDGRDFWDYHMDSVGLQDDPDTLWDALIAARQGVWAGKSALQITSVSADAKELCDFIRLFVGESVPDEIILAGLRAMPVLCAFCEGLAWESCDECGGCPSCYDVDLHCPDCGWPAGICGDPCDSCGVPMQPAP